MRNLITLLIATCFAFSYNQTSAQSEGYIIESFQDVYTELTTYESVSLLTDGDLFWELEFPLEFQFPFYDSVYNRVIYRHEAWGSFTDEEDEALFLMVFTRAYAFDDLIDTSNITSDVRFSHVLSNNMQAFVLQYTNNRFFADPSKDEFDTYLNFQIWLYENGVMEVHFGEMHMDGNPIYAPGKGFYCYTTSGGVDTNEVCGPFMGISNPADEEDAIALSGSYDNFEVVGTQYSALTVLPPQGWIIRFKPTIVATSDPRTSENLVISPNPANDFVHLPDINGRVFVYDGIGRILYAGFLEKNFLDISSFPSGIIYIRSISEDKLYTGRFVRQ